MGTDSVVAVVGPAHHHRQGLPDPGRQGAVPVHDRGVEAEAGPEWRPF